MSVRLSFGPRSLIFLSVSCLSCLCVLLVWNALLLFRSFKSRILCHMIATYLEKYLLNFYRKASNNASDAHLNIMLFISSSIPCPFIFQLNWFITRVWHQWQNVRYSTNHISWLHVDEEMKYHAFIAFLISLCIACFPLCSKFKRSHAAAN